MDSIELLTLLADAINQATSAAILASETDRRRIFNRAGSTLAAIALAITVDEPSQAALAAGRNLIDSLIVFCADIQCIK
jgi:hypothetical protein